MTRAIRSVLVSLLVVVSVAAATAPAQASGVVVRLEVSLAAHSPPGAPVAACDVSVPAGANGLALLDAAVSSGCIQSYSAKTFPGFGRYVDCVNGVCEIADGLVSFWALFYDDAFADAGIESFQAASGRQLELAYSSVNCWFGVC